MIEKNLKENLTIALNVLYAICPSHVSKHNTINQTQVTLLMIPKGEGWHYLAVKINIFARL